jgi:hypothetical protein
MELFRLFGYVLVVVVAVVAVVAVGILALFHNNVSFFGCVLLYCEFGVTPWFGFSGFLAHARMHACTHAPLAFCPRLVHSRS